jgi:ABC-2 type transport system ATP-binding protein
LDPAGIVEVRKLLRSLGAEGRTVFVSSHLLSEVQQVADHVAILARGRCVRTGSVADVLSGGRATGLLVGLDDPDAGRRVLMEDGIAVAAASEGRLLHVALPVTEAGRVTRVLADHRLYVTELRPDQADLETVFLELTRTEPEAP